MGSGAVGIAKVIKDYGKEWKFQSGEIGLLALGLSGGVGGGLRGSLVLLVGSGQNHAWLFCPLAGPHTYRMFQKLNPQLLVRPHQGLHS